MFNTFDAQRDSVEFLTGPKWDCFVYISAYSIKFRLKFQFKILFNLNKKNVIQKMGDVVTNMLNLKSDIQSCTFNLKPQETNVDVISLHRATLGVSIAREQVK